MHQLLSRRDIIKTFVVTSAYSLINDKLWAAKVVSEVAAAPAGIDPDVGVARVQLSSFAAFNNDGGSVRLGSSSLTSSSEGGSVSVGLFPPIVISRISSTEYVALDTVCPHASNIVGACLGGVVNGRMNCSATGSQHGSRFDIRGQWVSGPANANLASYETSLADGILTIKLPGWGCQTTQQVVLNASEKRLELTVEPAFRSVEYEVRYRPNMAALPTVVQCANSLSGTINRNFVAVPSNDVTGRLKVYVLPQDGIYQIAIRMRTVV